VAADSSAKYSKSNTVDRPSADDNIPITLMIDNKSSFNLTYVGIVGTNCSISSTDPLLPGESVTVYGYLEFDTFSPRFEVTYRVRGVPGRDYINFLVDDPFLASEQLFNISLLDNPHVKLRYLCQEYNTMPSDNGVVVSNAKLTIVDA